MFTNKINAHLKTSNQVFGLYYLNSGLSMVLNTVKGVGSIAYVRILGSIINCIIYIKQDTVLTKHILLFQENQNLLALSRLQV